MFRLVSNPRFAITAFARYNSTINKGTTGFDLLKIATQSGNGDSSKLNNSFLDSQASRKQFARSTNIISNTTFDENPKVLARHMPRTGPGNGTSVEVRNGNVKSAISSLSRALRKEQVRETAYKQRYHLKPSKVKGELRTQKRKEWFHAGLKQLFKSVKDAKRRGY